MTRQQIFERAFWREFWMEIRRAKKHKQARRAVGARLLLLLVCAAYVSYYVFILHSLQDPITEIAIASILVLIFLVVTAVRYSQWRDARAQLYRDIADAPREISEQLARYAHALTAIHERALSELYLSKYELPQGFEVVTRRVKINTLQSTGAWNEIPSDVRGWMMRPDGDWPIGVSVEVLARSETLHTLLWSLALLPQLRPLDRLLEPLNFRQLAKALKKPAVGVLPTWELRIKRNEAQLFFTRCYAENIVRGHVQAESDDQTTAIDEWMSAIEEYRQPESFVGTESVRELANDTLANAAKSAALRLLTLTRVMELLDGLLVWSEFCEMIFQPLLNTKEATEVKTKDDANSTN